MILLQLAARWGVARLLVQGDSKLVVKQVCNEWKVNKPHLVPLVAAARELLAAFPEPPRMRHIPR